MADATAARPPSKGSRGRLAAVPEPALGHTTSPAVPTETAPRAPDLLAALDAGDDAAVLAWVRAHTPAPESLLVYGLLTLAGLVGVMDWPAVVLSAVGQLVVDRRFGGVEALAAELRAKIDALTAAEARA